MQKLSDLVNTCLEICWRDLYVFIWINAKVVRLSTYVFGNLLERPQTWWIVCLSSLKWISKDTFNNGMECFFHSRGVALFDSFGEKNMWSVVLIYLSTENHSLIFSSDLHYCNYELPYDFRPIVCFLLLSFLYCYFSFYYFSIM